MLAFWRTCRLHKAGSELTVVVLTMKDTAFQPVNSVHVAVVLTHACVQSARPFERHPATGTTVTRYQFFVRQVEGGLVQCSPLYVPDTGGWNANPTRQLKEADSSGTRGLCTTEIAYACWCWFIELNYLLAYESTDPSTMTSSTSPGERPQHATNTRREIWALEKELAGMLTAYTQGSLGLYPIPADRCSLNCRKECGRSGCNYSEELDRQVHGDNQKQYVLCCLLCGAGAGASSSVFPEPECTRQAGETNHNIRLRSVALKCVEPR